MSTAWNDIIGHKWATDLLSGAILNDRVGHAYLLTGPEQVGKTTLARTFAQALNCEDPDPANRPCGHCRPCKLIANDRHPDVYLVTPEISGRGKRTLKIDEIRQLQQDLNLAAYEARRKVSILPHFDAATQGAANAFLKTLEEPPPGVVLLLTAADADSLLPTISSRCRVIALRPLPAGAISHALQQRWHLPPDKATRLGHLADGRPGWVIDALEHPNLLQEREEQLETLHNALAGSRVERFALADTLAKNAETLPFLLRTWLSWWRDLALMAWGSGQNGAVVNVDRREQLHGLARHWDTDAVLTALTHTRDAIWQLEHNANTRLVLENLFLTYPLPEKLETDD